MRGAGATVHAGHIGIGTRIGTRIGIAITALWLAFTGAALAGPAADAPADRRSDGLRIYRDGRLPDGARLAGQGAGGAVVSTPCAGCHRDSGMGGGEGGQRVAPITAIDLFQSPAALERPAAGDRLPRARPGVTVQPGRRLSRPGYDLDTLARALRTGLDAGGRPLDALMPRYPQLDDAAVQALAAHLATLRTDAAPGWIQPGPEQPQAELRLATIVTPDAAPRRVRALLDTLQAWQAQHQSPRVRLRPVLQVWRLEGPPETWADQLSGWQARQDVFAVLSGAAGPSADSWAPVQDWCEREALPCLLPLLDTPPETPAGAAAPRWSLHGSEGSRLEAAALALWPGLGGGLVTQWTDDATARRAADVLDDAMAEAGLRRAERFHLPPDLDGDALLARWCTLGPTDTLVLWTGADRVEALDRALRDVAPACPGPGQVVLSASRSGHRPPAADRWLGRGWQVSAELDDTRLQARTVLALQPWAQRSGVVLDAPREQAKAYAAAMWFTEALARMQGRIGRDYLMESLERTVDNRAVAGPWQSASLGPDQRVAVKSARMLQIEAVGGTRRWQPVGPPLRP
ncbi:c-type cytochrome [Leptothrix sp. BB-4]